MFIYLCQETQRTSRSLIWIGLRLLPTYNGRKVQTSSELLSFLSPFFLLLPHLAFFLTTPPFLPSASACSTLISPLFFREGDWRPLSLLKKETLSILPTNYFPLSSHPYFFSWEKGSRAFLLPRAELGAEEPSWKIYGQRQSSMWIQRCQSHLWVMYWTFLHSAMEEKWWVIKW